MGVENMNSQTITVKNIQIKVYPEHGLSKENAIREANFDSLVVVSGFSPGPSVIVTDGKTSFVRKKIIHPLDPVPKKLLTEGKCQTFTVKGIKVLPIICYELLFPDLWINLEKPDVVTHHVGFPMFDISQMEGWRALHRVLAKHYKCPVVVCCGGSLPDPLNLSGIVYPKRNIVDYSELYEHKKYDSHWR